MSTRSGLRALALAGVGAITLGACVPDEPGTAAAAEGGRAAGFTVDAGVALHSFMSLGDAHLQKTADVLALVAATEVAREGDWERIRPLLTEAARMTVPAVHWFAMPNGTYWTVETGRAAASLADRAYFGRVMAGESVIGDLVVSRSTHRNTAIVAVPIRGNDRSVVGALGSSVHLDSLSALLREEMGGLEGPFVFFAIDAEPLGALHSDPDMIFTEPMKLGDEGMTRAFIEMLASEEGVVTYDFRGSRRTVLYRKSPVTGWWYGFGTTHQP